MLRHTPEAGWRLIIPDINEFDCLIAVACLDLFDTQYKEDCDNGHFENRFYFDHDRQLTLLINQLSV